MVERMHVTRARTQEDFGDNRIKFYRDLVLISETKEQNSIVELYRF